MSPINRETRNAFLLSLALASVGMALLVSWLIDGSLSPEYFWVMGGVALVAGTLTHFLCVRAWSGAEGHTKAANVTAASVGWAIVVAFLLIDVPFHVTVAIIASGVGFFAGAGVADLRVGRAPADS